MKQDGRTTNGILGKRGRRLAATLVATILAGALLLPSAALAGPRTTAPSSKWISRPSRVAPPVVAQVAAPRVDQLGAPSLDQLGAPSVD